MARPMSSGKAKSQAHEFFPDFLEQREIALELDKWARGDQEAKANLYVPKHYNINDEYDDLISRSPTPWLGLGITSLVQTMRVEGVSRHGSNDMMEVWETWQQNRWDSRQVSLYRSSAAHGIAYARALPGVIPLTGQKSAVLKGLSALSTAAWYQDVDDEWPMFDIHATETTVNEDGSPGWNVELTDEVATYSFVCKGDGEDIDEWTHTGTQEHNLGIDPLVRYPNMTDLDGRHTSEVEPFIPLARRIDQDTFDRLIVQRFGAWKIRFIAGLQRPANMSETDYQTSLLKMKINDFLIADSKDTKFGTLPETGTDGFIKARDSDLRDLSAVLQVPPYFFLGLSANMQAESLAAARSALMAKSQERRLLAGENHEQLFRLTAKIRGNDEEMRAYDMQVRWADTDVRPLSQAADALGKLAGQVGVPLEMLWERIPNWTDSDTARAKALIEAQGFDALLGELEGQLARNGGGADLLGSPGGIRGQVTQVP